MKKFLVLLILCGLGYTVQAKMPPAFVQLKAFGKTFNCNALPSQQKEIVTHYTCSLPPNDPDLTSVSIQEFWVTQDDIFKPQSMLEELLEEAITDANNKGVFPCPKPNPNVAVGSGSYNDLQVLLRVTPNTVLILENRNPKNNWLDTAHLSYLCK